LLFKYLDHANMYQEQQFPPLGSGSILGKTVGIPPTDGPCLSIRYSINISLYSLSGRLLGFDYDNRLLKWLTPYIFPGLTKSARCMKQKSDLIERR
jgi:hypothetical protein